MKMRMTRADRLADVIRLLREVTSDNAPSREPDEAAARQRLEEVIQDILPKYNAHLRAFGLRPVDADKVYRGKERPTPSFHLLLLGMRMATRMERVEKDYLTSRTDAPKALEEAKRKLCHLLRVDPPADFSPIRL